jgi:membrane protease YdiL (CAAX protease family)
VFDIILQFSPFLLVYLLLQFAVNKQQTHPHIYEWIVRFIITVMVISYSAVIVAKLPALAHLDQIGEKSTLQSLALLLVSITALAILIPSFRRLISHSIPIDPTNIVHTVSLGLSFIVFVMYILTAFSLEQLAQDQTSSASIGSMWTQNILCALIAMIGVGWLQRRNTKETLARLGIVRPTFRMIMVGIGFGICFVILNLYIEQLATYFGFGIDPNVDKVTTQQLGPLFTSIPGVLTLGLAAALGEELLFRGAMLPKFGLIYTSILFTLVHSNYGFSIATLIVFILAISLGLLRKRYSTTVTMATHASYNIILGLFALIGTHLLK